MCSDCTEPKDSIHDLVVPACSASSWALIPLLCKRTGHPIKPTHAVQKTSLGIILRLHKCWRQALSAAAGLPDVLGGQHFLALALGEPATPNGDASGRVSVAVLDARGGVRAATLCVPGPARREAGCGALGRFAAPPPHRSDLRSTDGVRPITCT